MEISWLKQASDVEVGGENVGDYIYRKFRHDYSMKEYDGRTKQLIKSKDDFNISVERYKIISVNERTVTISELGRKSDGTYGFRVYDRKSGRCIDDMIPPSNKSRRSIKPF